MGEDWKRVMVVVSCVVMEWMCVGCIVEGRCQWSFTQVASIHLMECFLESPSSRWNATALAAQWSLFFTEAFTDIIRSLDCLTARLPSKLRLNQAEESNTTS